MARKYKGESLQSIAGTAHRGEFTPLAWQQLSELDSLRERITKATAALPFTLCHGDLHCQNVFTCEQNKLYIFDWGSACYAPVGADLGELLAIIAFRPGNPVEAFEQILEAYLEGIGSPAPARAAIATGALYTVFHWLIPNHLAQFNRLKRNSKKTAAAKRRELVITLLDFTARQLPETWLERLDSASPHIPRRLEPSLSRE